MGRLPARATRAESRKPTPRSLAESFGGRLRQAEDDRSQGEAALASTGIGSPTERNPERTGRPIGALRRAECGDRRFRSPRRGPAGELLRFLGHARSGDRAPRRPRSGIRHQAGARPPLGDRGPANDRIPRAAAAAFGRDARDRPVRARSGSGVATTRRRWARAGEEAGEAGPRRG